MAPSSSKQSLRPIPGRERPVRYAANRAVTAARPTTTPRATWNALGPIYGLLGTKTGSVPKTKRDHSPTPLIRSGPTPNWVRNYGERSEANLRLVRIQIGHGQIQLKTSENAP